MNLFKAKIFSSGFLAIILLGLALRIITMLWSFNFRENTDVLAYRDYGRISYLYGFKETYDPKFINFGTIANYYPPGSLYILSSSYNLDLLFSKAYLHFSHLKEGEASWMNGQLIDGFIRLPSILADLIIGWLIYLIVKEKSSKTLAIIASSSFIFSPAVIYNSSFWGQTDSLNNLFFFLSLFFLSRKKYFLTILLFFTSIFTKISLLIALPMLALIIFILVKNKRKLILYLLATGLIFYTLTIPVSANPLWLMNLMLNTWTGAMQNITAFAFNFWWLIFNPLIQFGSTSNLFNFSEVRLIGSPSSQTVYFGLSLGIWAFILFATALIPFIRKIIILKEKIIKPKNIFLLFSAVALIGFIFLPRMHERYIYPLFPLLATYVGFKPKFIWFLILFNILNLINLYLVWHPMIISFAPYPLISNHLFQWLISLFTIITSLIFYIMSVKNLNEN